jgi:hypothetical protein
MAMARLIAPGLKTVSGIYSRKKGGRVNGRKAEWEKGVKAERQNGLKARNPGIHSGVVVNIGMHRCPGLQSGEFVQWLSALLPFCLPTVLPQALLSRPAVLSSS